MPSSGGGAALAASPALFLPLPVPFSCFFPPSRGPAWLRAGGGFPPPRSRFALFFPPPSFRGSGWVLGERCAPMPP